MRGSDMLPPDGQRHLGSPDVGTPAPFETEENLGGVGCRPRHVRRRESHPFGRRYSSTGPSSSDTHPAEGYRLFWPGHPRKLSCLGLFINGLPRLEWDTGLHTQLIYPP